MIDYINSIDGVEDISYGYLKQQEHGHGIIWTTNVWCVMVSFI